MTTEKLVPVRAPVRVPILKIQIPFAGPSRVKVPVNVAAASTVDTGPKRHVREGARQGLVTRLGRERGVRAGKSL